MGALLGDDSMQEMHLFIEAKRVGSPLIINKTNGELTALIFELLETRIAIDAGISL